MQATNAAADSTVVQGPECLKLRTSLRADERLALRREVKIDQVGADICMTSPFGESVLEGVDVNRFNAVVSKLDGTRTLRELKSELGPTCGASFVTALVRELLHIHIRVVPGGSPHEDRSLIVVDGFLDDPDAARSEALKATYAPVQWFDWPGLFSTFVSSNVSGIMKRIDPGRQPSAMARRPDSRPVPHIAGVERAESKTG